MPGRWILTATLIPSGNSARCTWPIEAAARGSHSKERKKLGNRPTKLVSKIRRTSSEGNGLT